MNNDRFLNGILTGIGVLILIALVLFFVRQQQAEYLPDDSPEGVVHNYILGVVQHDYERAYSYLADIQKKPDFPQFQMELARSENEIKRVSVTFGEIFITDDSATVALNMSQSYGGPITRSSWYAETAQLIRENGTWKIVNMPYPLWSWNWYNEVIKPLP
ncbi:MAG: hypothetical protein CVU41_14505 [Chloroflexi bacterium HGW-Chloroflexi-3]|nr:MAG: hypothetical protein CVU41_14505 [Chloroflexi bacterium HGW-Chloroflexi-3]